VYFIEVRNTDKDETIALAYGDLETIAYHTRKLTLEPETEYAARVLEVESIGNAGVVDGAGRKVVSLEADGEIVSLYLRKKIAAERKQAAAGATTSAPLDTV
jgi:hypothetical protein